MVKRVDDEGSVAIHLRLSRAAWLRYANEAATVRKPLGTYLRERLERQEELLEEFASIRGALARLEASQAKPAPRGEGEEGLAGFSAGALLEVLLLLRGSSKVDQLKAVWVELARIGVERFQSADPASRTR